MKRDENRDPGSPIFKLHTEFNSSNCGDVMEKPLGGNPCSNAVEMENGVKSHLFHQVLKSNLRESFSWRHKSETLLILLAFIF